MRIEKEFRLVVSDDVRLYTDSGHYYTITEFNHDEVVKYLLDRTFFSTIEKIELLEKAKGFTNGAHD